MAAQTRNRRTGKEKAVTCIKCSSKIVFLIGIKKPTHARKIEVRVKQMHQAHSGGQAIPCTAWLLLK